MNYASAIRQESARRLSRKHASILKMDWLSYPSGLGRGLPLVHWWRSRWAVLAHSHCPATASYISRAYRYAVP
jgi:hypothetical protein